MQIDLSVNVFHYFPEAGTLAEMLTLLRGIQQQGVTIMATEQQALDALKKIDEATTAQGASLQKISDNLDALIAKLAASGVPQTVIDGIQAEADKLSAQADFSKALASKGAANPVPMPAPVD